MDSPYYLPFASYITHYHSISEQWSNLWSFLETPKQNASTFTSPHLSLSLTDFRLRRATFDLGEARDETRQGFPHKGENSVVPTSGGREMMKLYEIVRSLEYYL